MFGYNRESPSWNDRSYENCSHKMCEKCGGSGRDKFGRICIHMISCCCKRCSNASLSNSLGNSKRSLIN